MRKKKIFSFLLAGANDWSDSFDGDINVSAEENQWSEKEQLSDNKTAAPEKDKAVPNNSQYKYQKTSWQHFVILDRTHLQGKSGETIMEIQTRTNSLH